MPLEFQIVLVAGYIAYKITNVGRNRNHRTEDFLLQVLTFGLLSRASTAAALWLWPSVPFDDALKAAAIAALTVIAATVLGTSWRGFGERGTRWVMHKLNVYRDDHETSVWQSIMNNPAKWTVVQVHLDNGSILEANFGRMKPFPKTPVVINEDGIGMYVTGRYKDDDRFDEWDITGNDNDVTFTFIPRSSIKQVDVSWQLSANQLEGEFVSASAA